MLLLSCTEENQEAPQLQTFTTTGSGGISASIVTPLSTTIASSETLRIQLYLEHPAETKLQLPEQAATWGDFTILEIDDAQPKLTEDGSISLIRAYTLEPDLPGKYTLPPLTITTDLKTAPVPIEVTSVLAAEQKDLQPIATATSSSSVSKKEREPTWFMPVAVLLFLIVISGIRLLKSAKSKRAASAGTDHEAAFLRLENATPQEIMRGVEPAFTRLYAQQQDLAITAPDFPSLMAAQETPPPALVSAIHTYERLQYSATTPPEAEIRALYESLAKLIGKGDA